MEDEFDTQLFLRGIYWPSVTTEEWRIYWRVQEVLLQTKQPEALGKEMGMGQERVISIALDSLCPMFTILESCKKVIDQYL